MKKPGRKPVPITYEVDERGCHVCTSHGSGHKLDYPAARRDGIHANISRIVFARTYGPIPPGMCVCHTCDNLKCINPEHLFLGTHKDNHLDMIRKGRERVVRGVPIAPAEYI